MSSEPLKFDLFKLIITLLILTFFIFITYKIIEPFLFGFFWALMVVVTTWPILIKIQKKLFYNRLFATLVMCFIILLVFITPITLITINITKNSGAIIAWAESISKNGLPTFDALASIPFFGQEIHEKWLELIRDDGSELIKTIQDYFLLGVPWVIDKLVSITTFIFHCGVMIIFSSILYMKGDSLGHYLYQFAHKLSPQYGVEIVTLTSKSIRAVSLGVVVTALVLSLIGGSGLVMTGVPFTGFLTILLFICCVVQIGPVLIMVLATIWQFYNGNVIQGVILIVFALVLTVLDSLMRTLLIKKGVDLPFFLIIFGVIGGVLAFGAMGLFLGPVMFALIYNFSKVWVSKQD